MDRDMVMDRDEDGDRVMVVDGDENGDRGTIMDENRNRNMVMGTDGTVTLPVPVTLTVAGGEGVLTSHRPPGPAPPAGLPGVAPGR